MYDTWVDSIEKEEMAGVMMLDLSAAFDLVDHSILLKKLELLGFDQQTVIWFWSYLTKRSQCVYVDGKTSELKPVNVGVPQGSVLGPLMYILFVNDLPEVVHGHPGHHVDQAQVPFNMNCTKCGGLCCYVDDSTYVFSNADPEELSKTLTKQYSKLAMYMGDNRLVINDDKTHLLVMATPKYANTRKEVSITTPTVKVKPIQTEKLLGIHIHESLKWKEHVLSNKKSKIKLLTTRLSGLKKISQRAAFKTRLMVANSCFISVISYMISVWGGTECYIIKAVQLMQNKAARTITKKSWFTPTQTLLLQCNWLSIRQLIFYHSVIQVWRVRTAQLPRYIHSKLQSSITRSSEEGTLRIPPVERSLSAKSFLVRAAVMWNSVPPAIRDIKKIEELKPKLKTWIKQNVELE